MRARVFTITAVLALLMLTREGAADEWSNTSHASEGTERKIESPGGPHSAYANSDVQLVPIAPGRQDYAEQAGDDGGGIHPAGDDVVFVLDVSGSMAIEFEGGVKIDSAKEAALDVLTQIRHETEREISSAEVAVVAFESAARTWLALSSDLSAVETAINGLEPDGETNLGDGLTQAADQLSSQRAATGGSVILLSDGLTNTGLSHGDILRGPAQRLADDGVCLSVVGIGDPTAGGVDEIFLKELAATSPCGQYLDVDNALSLRGAFVESFHGSSRSIVDTSQGDISEGETKDIGSFVVPDDQAELVATLIWPGSTLRLGLTDPSGEPVDETYEGASIETTDRLVDVAVERPKAGTWTASVFGADVPGGSTQFQSVVSVRASSFRQGGSPVAVLLMLVLAGAIALGFIVLTRSRNSGWEAVLPGGHVIALRRGSNLVGRSSSSRVRLPSSSISRRHADVDVRGDRVTVRDLGSENRTFVNGRSVQSASVNDGDEITFGEVRLRVRRLLRTSRGKREKGSG